MAQLTFRSRTLNRWKPASYTANETATVMAAKPGDLFGPMIVRIDEVFNGSGTDAIIIVGDGAVTDRFLAAGQADETTVGDYLANGGANTDFSAQGYHLYLAADTVDIGFTANTLGTRTTGIVSIFAWVAKAIPN